MVTFLTQFFMNLSVKKIILIFLFILIYDFLFFYPLFFPKEKLIVTPEFGGGDTLMIQLPFKYELCRKVKHFSLPFWSKNMSMGYPLLAEGEVGAFNPINLVTCFFFNYKTAFNLQILIHTVLGQIGLLLLAKELKMTSFSGLFLSSLFPFTPMVIMNYMQISLIYPLFFAPFILVGLIRLFKKPNYQSFLFLSFSIFFQFLASHFQVSFISFIFSSIFFLSLLFLSNYQKKQKLKQISLFILSWLTGFLAAGIQTIPSLEFVFSSDRLGGSFATHYDENLTFKNWLTIFSPYLLGKAQNGSYPLTEIAHPWEGTFFIYYIPLVFFVLCFLKINQWNKKKYFKALLIAFFLILLIAMGQNSPLYFIHYLPIFSSFRFPSRFVLMVIFIISLFSTFGFDFFLKRIKNNKIKLLVFFICVSGLFIESFYFTYNFHVLLKADKLYLVNNLIKTIKKIQKETNVRLYSSLKNSLIINKKYVSQGYQGENQLFYYHFVNNLVMPNINIIYGLSSFSNKAGPQIKRFSKLQSKAFTFDSEKGEKLLTRSASASAKNILTSAAVSHIVSYQKLKENWLKLEKTFYRKEIGRFYLYSLKTSKPRIQFFGGVKLIETLRDYERKIEEQNIFDDYLLVEDKNLENLFKNTSKVNGQYHLITDEDGYLKIITKTDKKGFLYLADSYYPGWRAYIDGKKAPIYRVNLFFRGIILPKGQHQVEFLYVPLSFFVGLSVTLITIVFLVFGVRFFLKAPPPSFLS